MKDENNSNSRPPIVIDDERLRNAGPELEAMIAQEHSRFLGDMTSAWHYGRTAEPEHPHCRCVVDDVSDMHRAEYMADVFRRFLVAMACIIVAVALGVALLLWVAS